MKSSEDPWFLLWLLVSSHLEGANSIWFVEGFSLGDDFELAFKNRTISGQVSEAIYRHARDQVAEQLRAAPASLILRAFTYKFPEMRASFPKGFVKTPAARRRMEAWLILPILKCYLESFEELKDEGILGEWVQ